MVYTKQEGPVSDAAPHYKNVQSQLIKYYPSVSLSLSGLPSPTVGSSLVARQTWTITTTVEPSVNTIRRAANEGACVETDYLSVIY